MTGHEMGSITDPAVPARPPADDGSYEPPRVSVLGTLAEMTLGRRATRSDGLNPGSLF